MKPIKVDEKLLAQTLRESKQLKQFNELEAKQLVREQFNPAIKKAAKRLAEEEIGNEDNGVYEAEDEVVAETTETKVGEYHDTPMDEAEGMEDSDKIVKEEDEEILEPETSEEPEVLLDMEEVENMVDEMIEEPVEEAEEEPIKEEEEPVKESDDADADDTMKEEEELMKEVDAMLADEDPLAEEAPEEVKVVGESDDKDADDMIKELEEPEEEKAPTMESIKRKKALRNKINAIVKENVKLKSAVRQISKNVNEANLDRTKNQLISSLWKMPLSREQKYTIAEHFDKAKTVDQVKMIYDMIKEAVVAKKQINKVFGKNRVKSYQSIKESVDPKGSKKPLKESEMVSYFGKLVNEKYY